MEVRPLEPNIERIEAYMWTQAAERDSGALRLAVPRFRHTFRAGRPSKPWSSRSWVHHHPPKARPEESPRAGHPPAQA